MLYSNTRGHLKDNIRLLDIVVRQGTAILRSARAQSAPSDKALAFSKTLRRSSVLELLPRKNEPLPYGYGKKALHSFHISLVSFRLVRGDTFLASLEAASHTTTARHDQRWSMATRRTLLNNDIPRSYSPCLGSWPRVTVPSAVPSSTTRSVNMSPSRCRWCQRPACQMASFLATRSPLSRKHDKSVLDNYRASDLVAHSSREDFDKHEAVRCCLLVFLHLLQTCVCASLQSPLCRHR